MATYRFSVPDWRPPSLNVLLSRHWGGRSRLKREAAELVGGYWLQAGHPKATGKRRVSIELTGTGRDKTLDDDNAKKILLDALKLCGAIVDDSPAYCETPPVTQVRGARRGTVVTLEDV